MSDSRQSAAIFFALTYVVSWSCFLAAGAIGRPLSGGQLSVIATILLLAGTIAPSLVALSMTARAAGADGVAAIIERIGRYDVPARWYAFAVGYMAVVKLFAAFLQRTTLGTWPPSGDTPWLLLVGAIAISTPVQAGEEVGWRGFALPALTERFGLRRASLLVGLFWGVWHLPLFFIPGIDNYGQSFILFTLGTIGLSVAMAWLYERTGGSLLLTMLMHSAINQTTLAVRGTAPTLTNPFALSASPLAWFTVAGIWIGSGYLLVRMQRVDSPEPLNRSGSKSERAKTG